MVTYADLPSTKIIERLEIKLAEYSHLDIDFLGILNSLRKRVSQEIGYINVLFPEYTPHDESYHIKNLFNIADKLLETIIDDLSGIELFVLAASLYGHDWGMAVSKEEKECIKLLVKGSEVQAKENHHQFSLLNNEKELFNHFCLKNNLHKNEEENFKVPDELWQEYVRNTHAERSGQRVLDYLLHENQALAIAVQKVCVGHWLDFSKIRNANYYPEHYSILNENINIRALAIYVRLIDLLDLTADRTPYVLWKFVSPTNAYSKMEWNKHRALHALSFAPYQSGRKIRVTGETDDHNVYAALNDLSQWVDNQLKGCNDTIAELHETKYRLNIFHIDWSITAKGFDPMPIKIEFNRDKMLDILSEEIYDKDPYVFLRELLQNSIDAIKMRRALLKSKGLNSNNFGEIHVNVKRDNDTLIVTWKDNGIGMDEHIVKNYFSVAGNSYYSSKDFEDTGLKLDPISKFGIGLLSCNAVSDYIEIETRRDPYIKSSKKLKITIPSFKLHFRIESIEDQTAEVGTTIKVYIDEEKIIENYDIGKELKITEYLSYIAGFVDIPILVTENDNKTVIVHPNVNEQDIKERYGVDVEIKKTELGYEWESLILPQDLSNAKLFMEERIIDIQKDLEIEGYEGTISYLYPKNKNIDYYEDSDGIRFEIEKDGEIKIRFYDRMDNTYRFCKSLYYNPSFSIYRDGILLSGIQQSLSSSRYDFLPVRFNVNISKDRISRINIARTNSLETGWFDLLTQALNNYIIKDKVNNAYHVGLELAYVSTNLYKSINENENIYKDVNLPFLNKDGLVVYKRLKDDQDITILPVVSEKDYRELYKFDRINSTNLYNKWIGSESILAATGLSSYDSSVGIYKTNELIRKIVTKSYFFNKLQILVPPTKELPLIPQQVWSQIPNEVRDITFEETIKSFNETGNLTNYEIYLIQQNLSKSRFHKKNKLNITLAYTFIEFPHDFNNYFGFGSKFININHPKGKRLFKVFIKLFFLESNNKISPKNIGIINDFFDFRSVYSLNLYGDESYEDYELYYSKLLNILTEVDVIKNEELESLFVEELDFIPNSFQKKRTQIILDSVPFGQLLESSTV